MTQIKRKRVIHLDPFAVQDDTLATLKDELRAQADADLNDIQHISKVVIDSNKDGGLDSHATIFTTSTSSTDGDAQ